MTSRRARVLEIGVPVSVLAWFNNEGGEGLRLGDRVEDRNSISMDSSLLSRILRGKSLEPEQRSLRRS